MLRSSISFLLLGLMLFSLFYNAVISIGFELRRSELTELFCVNKEKPELNCDANCYISKELLGFEPLFEAPEIPVSKTSYLPSLKNFVVKKVSTLRIGTGTILDQAHKQYAYCFWESNYPDPPFNPPQFTV